MKDQDADVRHLEVKSSAGTVTVQAPDKTQTEKANLLFLERISSLPGVVSVESYGGPTIEDLSFRVYLRRDDLDTEYAIYDIEGEMYDRYPKARFYVEILEMSGSDTLDPILRVDQ